MNREIITKYNRSTKEHKNYVLIFNVKFPYFAASIYSVVQIKIFE